MTPVGDVAALFDGLPDPAMLLDPRGRVALVNRPARDRFGAWIDGQSYVSVLRQPVLVAPVEEAFASGASASARFRHAAGEVETVFEVRITALRAGDAGTRPPVLLYFRDVTDAALGAAQRQDFVANVSHELKTPLTSLIGFVQTLQGPARNDAAARSRFLDLMAQDLARMDRLVSDLLSLSRVEGEARRPLRDVVDLARLTAEALDPLRATARAVGVEIETVLPPGAPALAERDQIIQLVLNLAENAVKYGRRPGIVRVTLERRDREPVLRGPAWSLSVRDEGDGIAAEHLPRLTERFYRVDPGRGEAQGGTGLGLAIVKHIVNRHRGRLRIESTPGLGTIVTVVLPAPPADDEGRTSGERPLS